VLEEVHNYVVSAGDVGVDWQIALDEQLVQKVLPRVRGADARFDEALAGFAQALDERFPLSRTKAELMRQDYASHGFASFF
jgi:hypothetical protein